MIERMSKLTFLIYHGEYESFLEQIRQLGVVHVVERQRGEPDETLQAYIQKRTLCKRTLDAMLNLAGGQTVKTVAPHADVDALLAQYEELQNNIQNLSQRLPQIDKDIAQMEVWGDFDVQTLNKLSEAGWGIRFYSCPEREYKDEWTEPYNVIRISDSGSHVSFVTVSAEAIPDIEPLRLPALSLSGLKQQRVDTENELAAANEALVNFCRENYATLSRGLAQLQGDIDLRKVKLNSEVVAGGVVRLMEGWIPANVESDVRALLDNSGVYYEIRPAVKEDNAPIKLKNNAFTRMYEVLTKMYGMPQYAEFDPTPILAPFFSLFFGFCMGDAGYGLVLIALGFLLKSKMSKSMAGMMNLVITLGIFTTVIGAILGTFFGVSLTNLHLPDSIAQFMIVGKIDGTTYDKQMLLALIIGVVHLCIAMTVKAITSTVRYGFRESLSAWGWLLLVVGFVCTGALSFFEMISTNVTMWAFYIIGGVAAIGIYLLNNIHRNVFANIGAGLWDTYNMATGLLGDVLSYIRLYALGLAGAMLGGVFNQLAFMVYDAAGPAIGWLFCGLILVLGHTLNIAMSCLSAFVHPLRLSFVEYFKNSGYSGKGETYTPFTAVESK